MYRNVKWSLRWISISRGMGTGGTRRMHIELDYGGLQLFIICHIVNLIKQYDKLSIYYHHMCQLTRPPPTSLFFWRKSTNSESHVRNDWGQNCLLPSLAAIYETVLSGVIWIYHRAQPLLAEKSENYGEFSPLRPIWGNEHKCISP